MIYKKSVVLSSLNGGKEKAVVTFEYDGGETIGNVRLYNFSKEPEGVLSLGILQDGKIFLAIALFKRWRLQPTTLRKISICCAFNLWCILRLGIGRFRIFATRRLELTNSL